jgi:hypothetical protein
MMPDLGTITRFYEKIDFDGPAAEHVDSACWMWTGAASSNGYGSFWDGTRTAAGNNRAVPAHRFAYALIVGKIPDGMFLDHLCGVPLCVFPSHLEVVTNKVNLERRTKGANANSTSGVRGVYWHKGQGKWMVQVGHNGFDHHGGYFTDKADAEQSAIALRDKLFGPDLNRREFVVAGESELAVSA